MKGLCRLLFSICHITRRWRKGKGLEVPSEYNYYCGPINDPELFYFIYFIIGFIAHTKLQINSRPGIYFTLMLFPWPLNEIRLLYETDYNSRQYGMYIVCRYVCTYVYTYICTYVSTYVLYVCTYIWTYVCD